MDGRHEASQYKNMGCSFVFFFNDTATTEIYTHLNHFLLIVKKLLHNNYALHKQDFRISSNYNNFKWKNVLQRSRLFVLIASLIMFVTKLN
jgi:hypothetical protein